MLPYSPRAGANPTARAGDFGDLDATKPSGIDLYLERKNLWVGGRPGRAIAINGSIPGPIIRMREGENAHLRVHNRLAESTSIHWHGILLPFNMDGVPGISFPGIAPARPSPIGVLDRAAKPPPEDLPDAVPDDALHIFLLGDRLEYRFDPGDGPDHVGLEMQGWFGGDYNRLWIKFEGEGVWRGVDGLKGETETDLLYSCLISPFWNVQIGAQYANEWTSDDYEDLWSGQGLALLMFEVDLSMYLSEDDSRHWSARQRTEQRRPARIRSGSNRNGDQAVCV